VQITEMQTRSGGGDEDDNDDDDDYTIMGAIPPG
jgi:hypothetical protein